MLVTYAEIRQRGGAHARFLWERAHQAAPDGARTGCSMALMRTRALTATSIEDAGARARLMLDLGPSAAGGSSTTRLVSWRPASWCTSRRWRLARRAARPSSMRAAVSCTARRGCASLASRGCASRAIAAAFGRACAASRGGAVEAHGDAQAARRRPLRRGSGCAVALRAGRIAGGAARACMRDGASRVGGACLTLSARAVGRARRRGEGGTRPCVVGSCAAPRASVPALCALKWSEW